MKRGTEEQFREKCLPSSLHLQLLGQRNTELFKAPWETI